MRIAQLTGDWRPTGGLSTYLHLLTRALARHGHDVLVVHPETSDGPAMPVEVSVHAVPGSLRRGAPNPSAAATRVRSIVDDFAPDVIHLHGTNDFRLETELRARYPTTKTLHVYDFCPSGTKYHHVPGRACAVGTSVACLPRQVFNRCTLSRRPSVLWSNYQYATSANAHHAGFSPLVVASDYVKREAVRTGFDNARVEVLPYFTQLVPATPTAASRDVLFVGRLVREKGADLLLEALAPIRASWRCTIVGDGIDAAFVRRRARELGVIDRVSFTGWLTGEALFNAYARSAVVALPSRWPEPFGIIGIEALAHGRPVVAFRVGGIPEWLDDGVSGRLVAPLDTQAFGKQILDLLDHPETAATLGASGRARVERDFAEGPHLERLLPLYERMRDRH